MDYKSLTSLILRISGIIILLSILTAVPRTFANLIISRETLGYSTFALWLLTCVATVLPLAVGLFLIYFPSVITNKIIKIEIPVQGNSVDLSMIERVAFSMLGAYFIATALFDTFYWYAKYQLFTKFILVHPDVPIPIIRDDDFAGMVSTGLQFLIGVFLLLGSKYICGILTRMRGKV